MQEIQHQDQAQSLIPQSLKIRIKCPICKASDIIVVTREDIGFFGQRSPEDLKKICDEKGGLCFNTLGYIKHKVNPEKDFIYLPNSTKPSEGLYVKC